MDSQTTTAHAFDGSTFSTASVLKIRLDTSDILERLKAFLSGKIIMPISDEHGNTTLQEQPIGDPLCNDKGVQELVNIVQSIINPSVVQGNWDRLQYDNYLFRFQANLAYIIVCNYIDWEMAKKNRKTVSVNIMGLVEAYLSRLIDNKERDSYGQTMQTTENRRIDTGRNWNPFNKGGGEMSQ